ncbi:MAG TPA: hypothetical protein VL463_02865 [Kofleriaceae bacterium]|nr:hypothetical protein [Kofleriaceae bacterium]
MNRSVSIVCAALAFVAACGDNPKPPAEGPPDAHVQPPAPDAPVQAAPPTRVKNALVTDSAPSMSAYMTGVKMDNDVIAMSAETKGSSRSRT